MTQLHETMTVPPDHILRLLVPNVQSGEEVEVTVVSNDSASTLVVKDRLMAQVANDPLFLADVAETRDDFATVDAS